MNRNTIDTKIDTSTGMSVEQSVELSVEQSVEPSIEKSIKKPSNTYRQMIESIGGVASFCKGVSMLPLIRQGKGYVSVIAVDDPHVDDDPTSRSRSKWGYRESHGSAELAVNDIILFEQMRRGERMNILHRLIEIRRDGTYVCRGDNCLGCEYIRREDIIGRADRIFWTKEACSLMPRLLGADRDRQNGGWALSVNTPGYLRYVRVWNVIWPLRRIYYRLRGKCSPRRLYWRLRTRLSKIGWLSRLYKQFRREL